ncbi:MAG TPA: polysaccharide deacetylase family protein [Burkholderiales bacterium]|jgi:peptidoglycan/xylan/chitin deacetylase (PgdA/CDA1 family)|nr:polysaccharide deacetylase family protein [Burkholderiales bacterium]
MSTPELRIRWRPAPLVGLAVLAMAAACAAVAWRPSLWPWAAAAIAASFFLVTAGVFLPRSRWLGDNLTRLPAQSAARGMISLTFDDGPDPELTPRVLDLLDRHGAKATFFCIASKAAAHPELAREIVRRGHSVENHSLRHSNAFALYGVFRLRRDVESAQAILGGITGSRPSLFRAPMGLRSPLLDPVLARCGLRYVSWTRRGFDGVDRNAARILRRLAGALAAGDIVLLHDSRPTVLAVLPELLERVAAQGLTSVTLATALHDGRAV